MLGSGLRPGRGGEAPTDRNHAHMTDHTIPAATPHMHTLDRGITWVPCAMLTHCPSLCDCPIDECDAEPIPAAPAKPVKRIPRLVFVTTADGTRRAHYGEFDATITHNGNGWTLEITTHGLPLQRVRFRTLAGARESAQFTADILPAELFA